MISSLIEFEKQKLISQVMAVNNSDVSVVWFLFLILFIICGLLAVALLLIYSKRPEEWEHGTLVRSDLGLGKRSDVSLSVKAMPVDYSDESMIKNHIQTLFFEKMKSTHGLNNAEIYELMQRHPEKLREVVNDKDISDFILNFEKKQEERSFWDFLEKNEKSRKNRYLKNLEIVLDKMEVWGE